MGRVFVWKIEAACKAEDYGSAVTQAVAGSKFGFDLTGGGAMDAGLGMSIVDEIRRTLAPHLSKFEPKQLATLSAGMDSALKRKTPTEAIVENERQNFLLAIQTIQDDYRSGDFKKLENELGPSGREGVEKLQAAGKKDESGRAKYFEGFAQEAEQIAKEYAAHAKLSVEERQHHPLTKFSKNRPWRGLARHFLGTLEPLLSHEASTTARTRLLILTARLLAQKTDGFPDSLKGFSSELDKDPYSGKGFLYHHDASQFSLYSVGPNLKDDGGETDGTFSDPDLLLEQG